MKSTDGLRASNLAQLSITFKFMNIIGGQLMWTVSLPSSRPSMLCMIVYLNLIHVYTCFVRSKKYLKVATLMEFFCHQHWNFFIFILHFIPVPPNPLYLPVWHFPLNTSCNFFHMASVAYDIFSLSGNLLFPRWSPPQWATTRKCDNGRQQAFSFFFFHSSFFYYLSDVLWTRRQ